LKIVEIGLILQSPEGKDFRYVTFRDADSLQESKYMVYKTAQPYLWKNIEKAEQNPKTLSTIAGHIENYNGIDIVVFEGENVSHAFQKQKWKMKEQHKLTREEAEKKRMDSQGYITNQSVGDSMCQSWTPVDEKAKKISYRYLHKPGKHRTGEHSFFEWTDWFEIV